jgi:hypothetical protein
MRMSKDDAGEQSGRSGYQSFLLGERSLRAYFAGGNVRFLEDAEANFSLLTPGDRWFDNARFYLGIAKTQLRKTQESIKILEDLREHEVLHGGSNSDLANKIALQLAYAHIKSYTEDGYRAAVEELGRVEESAANTKDRELLVQAQAIEVFLYSVMTGRAESKSRRPEYAIRALTLGEQLLKTRSSLEVKFEALNALGITWMRIAESDWNELGEPAASWALAQSYYDQALTIVPHSVRVLQNIAQMRLLQVKHQFPEEPSVLLAEATTLCLSSLEVNDQDQYPFYLLAQIAVEQGDPKAAWEYINAGRNKPGAVTEESWARVESAASALADRRKSEKEAQA